MVNAGVERFLDGLFSDAAREREATQKNKAFRYVLRREYCGTPDKEGECMVISREYSRISDCDILRCKDVKTDETFFCNQFQIELKECS